MQPVASFCVARERFLYAVQYIAQSHKNIILATQLLEVTYHWSAGQYVTIRG